MGWVPSRGGCPEGLVSPGAKQTCQNLGQLSEHFWWVLLPCIFSVGRVGAGECGGNADLRNSTISWSCSEGLLSLGAKQTCRNLEQLNEHFWWALLPCTNSIGRAGASGCGGIADLVGGMWPNSSISWSCPEGLLSPGAQQTCPNLEQLREHFWWVLLPCTNSVGRAGAGGCGGVADLMAT